MTKCHPFVAVLLLLLLASCKSGDSGPSLADYAARSKSVKMARFEQVAQSLSKASPELARQMQDSLLDAASGDSAAWRQLLNMEENFFLDPNSPWRDEELYLPVAEQILCSPYSDTTERDHAAWLLERLTLNRPGTPAADFNFTTPKGRPTSLYTEIDARHPELTLLFFSNPGCPNCKEITEALERDLYIQKQLYEGTLLVVCIYPDEDLQGWLDYLPNYPEEWLCGCDPDQVLNSETRYWLRAIPSLYLLDEEKRVILKDAPLERIVSVLLTR